MTADASVRIVTALKLLPVLRAQIDADELALIEELRALDWSWRQVTDAYGTTTQGVQQRYQRLAARRNEGALPQSPSAPGDVLRKVIKGLGMSQIDLARETGLSAKHVNQVIKGYVPVSIPIAIKLEETTGIPAMLWNTIEAAYRDALARRGDA